MSYTVVIRDAGTLRSNIIERARSAVKELYGK
jgi:hypothetical protein